MRAQYGRLLTAADEGRDQNKVAVLSDDLWHEHFGADPSIVNRTILLDGEQVTVVGIAPREFRIPRGGSVLHAQIWTPLRFTDNQLQQRRSNFLPALGRLAPGATAESAEHELNALFNDIVTTYPQLRGEAIRVVPLTADASASVKTPLLLMFGAVVMVLLIAATNVASLLLARGVHRRRETAIRSALGGGRWAVMRPVLFESLLLTAIGAALGLGLAWAGVGKTIERHTRRRPLCRNSPDSRYDLRHVIAFALLLAVIVALARAVRFPPGAPPPSIRRTRCAMDAVAVLAAAGASCPRRTGGRRGGAVAFVADGGSGIGAQGIHAPWRRAIPALTPRRFSPSM